MATVVSQHVRHFGRLLGFFKNLILRKTAANLTEISRKHVFISSNRNIIENKETIKIIIKIINNIIIIKEITTNFPQNLQFSISNFNFHN